MIIISPAKKQVDHHQQARGVPTNLQMTEKLAQCMQSMSLSQLEKCLKISPSLAKLNAERMRHFDIGQMNTAYVSAAVYLYQGDVYRYLDVASLPAASIDYLQENLRIISAFYGLLKPLDGILPYRLEMVSRLPGFEDLAALWREQVTESLSKESIIFNLASNEYSKVIDQKRIKRWVDVVFLDNTPKGYRVVAVKAKRMRGMLLRYMILNQIEDPKALEAFAQNGYHFDPDGSTENRLLFKNG